ncbi:hypothetical protein QGN32_06525 [Mycolicibacterium sp. ND9-15]|uniref:DUF6290 family protein n=1 Tax=Mycolicibacterium sp. ND9-15 TaxID=3042320 RepID=UPI002DDC70BE|nr:hypothetical protein [Mycolicibacterium sp. ND9-15]WSE57530.1 hypothetical protein QGN32_06525 [Mycolicibacterium sp. ND9-15]
MSRYAQQSPHLDDPKEGVAETPTKNTTTFSLRLQPKDYEVLSSIAKLRNTSIAELARQFILDGIRASLDPLEINRMIEAEKQRLLQAAEEMRTAAV